VAKAMTIVFHFHFQSARPFSAVQLQTAAAAGWSFYRTKGKARIIRYWKWNVVDIFFYFITFALPMVSIYIINEITAGWLFFICFVRSAKC
jgi:hypothetical protein